METALLYKKEAFGTYGPYQIEITVGAGKLPCLDTEEIRCAVDTAAREVESALMAEVVKNNPEAMKQAAEEKRNLLALFPEGSFVEEIPNGYCSNWCCKHLPWFVVTTPVGRIKIGWRKRVIQIDWSETVGTKNSHELFANENVTKEDRLIHAWGHADARRYIDAILASTTYERS